MERFPQSNDRAITYGKTINANGSIDADAYSVGGSLYILVFALILFIIRIIISFSVPTESFIIKAFEGIGLGLLAFLPSSASLQAILLPQGLGLILFLLVILRIRSFKNDLLTNGL